MPALRHLPRCSLWRKTRPWDQLIHSAQEFLLAGLTALVTELAVSECKLLVHLCVLIHVQRILSHQADLFAGSLIPNVSSRSHGVLQLVFVLLQLGSTK